MVVGLSGAKSPWMSFDPGCHKEQQTVAFSSEESTRGRFSRFVHPYVTRRKEAVMEVLYARLLRTGCT